MKNFVFARTSLRKSFIRFLLTTLTVTMVMTQYPVLTAIAETHDALQPQVSDWIAQAKQQVWGEYPTVQDAWPRCEVDEDWTGMDLPSRSNAQQPIEPEILEKEPQPTNDVAEPAISVEPVPVATPTPVPTPVPTPTPSPTVSVGDWLSEIVRLTNAAREKNGLAPLALNSTLCQAADIRVSELPASPSPHLRPDGDPFYSVLSDVQMTANYCGENYAIDPTQSCSAEQIVNAWMNSPTHRKNILNSDFTGIAVSKAVLNGQVYIEQLFIG